MEIMAAFLSSILVGGMTLMRADGASCYTAIPLALGTFGFVMALFDLRRK